MNLGDLIDVSSFPAWMSTTALSPYASADWTEKNGKEISDTLNNNLNLTSDISTQVSGLSKISLVTKNTYYKKDDYWYTSDATLVLTGEDKTNYSIKYSLSEPSKESVTINFTTGSLTKDKSDDINFTLSHSEDKSSSTSSFKYADGLGTSIKFDYKEIYKTVGATGYDYHGTGTWSGTGTVTYSDAQKNALKISIERTGEISDGEMTDSTYSILAGSFQNYEYSITWGKVSADPLIENEIDLFQAESFPLEELITTWDIYIKESSNSIKLFTTKGETSSIDAGAGNDTVNGGVGDDTIIAGAGKDSLTGGKGDDTFVITFDDYNFSSAKTVLADTIADFKYSAIEQDSLSLEGFGDIEVYKSLALARTAGSTAEVIYESGTGKFWYNEDGDSALVGVMTFATVKGIPNTYWVDTGVM